MLMTAGMALCIGTEAFFSGTEIAMVSASRLTLRGDADQGDVGAQQALKLLEREDRLISTCLIGTNLSVITGTTLMALVIGTMGFGEVWALAYIPLTVVFGEALPKTVFQHHATWLAPRLARPLALAQLVFSPLLVLVGLWSQVLRRLAGDGTGAVTRQDIVNLLEEEEADIDPKEQEMIRRVFRLNEVSVEDAMTPLVDVDALPDTATCEAVIALAVEGGHSRIPIYHERVDNIVGLLETYDLLLDAKAEGTVADRMRPVTFVPETKRCDQLLHEMRQRRDPFAVVVDEYGGSVGVVTIEDLLEQIIGDIRDERDEDEPGLRKIADKTWRVPARTTMDELKDALATEFPDGWYETVAGMLLAHLGRIPHTGEIVEIGPVRFRVEEASDRAIVTVTATIV